MKKFNWVILLVVLSFPCHAWGQVDSAVLALADLVKTYNRFGMYNPQEKVYLHFDNTGYYLGETIWFQAYVVAAPQLRPTELSKVLYVELLTPEGRVVETKKLKIEEGRANGEFLLTDGTLVEGFYEVRAYTRVMLNWEGTYFSRVFPVFDKPVKEGLYNQKMGKNLGSGKYSGWRPETKKDKSPNVVFYPEGGDLVAGLPSIVAFKATDDEGRGVSVEGTICDDKGQVVANFSSVHGGMGQLKMTPENKSYEARITYNGKKYHFPLPKVKLQGYVMAIDNSSPDEMQLTLYRSPETEGEYVGITVSCRGITHAFEIADMRNVETVHLSFDKRTFPGGVQQVTLFSSRGEILSDRLVYHPSLQRLTISVDSIKNIYSPFECVNIGLNVKDESGFPVTTDFSLSVRDYGTEIPTYYQSNIQSNFLLESDLKGYIEDIPYYFESNDEEHCTALDLLMLVQGWRRYEWKQQAGVEEFVPEHLAEEGILVKGRVLSNTVARNSPVKDVDISLWIYSPQTNCRGHAITNEKGEFTFLSDSDIWGRNEMILQTQVSTKNGKKKNKHFLVELDRVFAPDARSYTYMEEQLPHNMFVPENTFESQEDSLSGDIISYPDTVKVFNLDEVEIKSQNKVGKSPRIEYNMADEEDKMVDSGDFRHFTGNIMDMLEYINPDFTGRYKRRGIRLVSNGLFFGDIDEIDRLLVIERISTEDIKYYVDEWNFKPGDFVMYRAEQPVFVLLFLKPAEELGRTAKGYRRTTLQGYSVAKDFFKVDYSMGHLPDEQDYRRTLYWNPNVRTDLSGCATISFYNNSNESHLCIDAETITMDGIVGNCNIITGY
ncbi:MAG: hypothetical protein LUI04_01765 [Porphyromonadaceae bacterium]|nr:hypothetical protein [Porphyromonadaceae bacterium]